LRAECTERSNLLLAKAGIASAVKLLRNDIRYALCSTSFLPVQFFRKKPESYVAFAKVGCPAGRWRMLIL
jgi:hypothetical protein